jgi:transmembrane sensor
MKTAMDHPAPLDGTDRAIERQASTWLLRLEDEPGDSTVQDGFEAWLAQDPRHGAVWRDTIALAHSIALIRPAPLPARRRMAPRRRLVPATLRGWRMAASGAAAACLLWAVLPGAILALRADQITGTAQTRSITLPDGSVATLAPDTAIRVAIRDGRRDVHLLRGEAYFDVRHDPAHPFRVIAGDSQTRVLGTAFDVRLASGHAAVAVARGLVEVSRPDTGQRQLLPRGQAMTVTWHRETIRPDRVAAWREGRLIVNDQPLGDVIAALRPWHRGMLIARGAGLATRRVTGLYDLRDSDAALRALTRIDGVEIARFSPWMTVVTVR